MVGVSTAIILDTRRALTDGTYPIKLRITHQRKQKYFPTDFSLSETDFAKTKTDNPRGKAKELQIAFQAIEQQAIKVIKKLSIFTIEAFEKHYLNTAAKDDVFSAFDHSIACLTKEEQVGTAGTYENASISLLAFINKQPLTSNKGLTKKEAKARREALLKKRKPLLFSTITPDFLKEYERWMLAGGKSLTTISIYVRALRTLFNESIAAGDVHQDLYPFGKRKYQVPAGRNVKKALPLAEIEKIFVYEPRHDSEAQARDLWLFSYLCNGINIKDIARLKYRQIQKGSIIFIRAKTERTTRQNLKPIIVILTPEVEQIIKKWGNKPIYPEAYVFPILKEGLTPEKELAVVKQATKTINKYIKRIGATIGIEGNISTYTARHSYATVLKRAGVSTAFISESLGHGTERTTQNYLDSFEDEVKREFTSYLTAFKSK
ncbi:integrase [Adhaeribacter aerolatus]|uniref:Integrase n=1 Tax=Adhaeribacter aerolatus TaxID=670289 RepID=A0A512AUI9_9BACT|nr:site-specific integrase [Adhaeribacter aerolatus]GEO03374.1 integrase [Adhaeribacter aerolatus]